MLPKGKMEKVGDKEGQPSKKERKRNLSPQHEFAIRTTPWRIWIRDGLPTIT